jgi:hypothetical protein
MMINNSADFILLEHGNMKGLYKIIQLSSPNALSYKLHQWITLQDIATIMNHGLRIKITTSDEKEIRLIGNELR